jgi:hypothetical protein
VMTSVDGGQLVDGRQAIVQKSRGVHVQGQDLWVGSRKVQGWASAPLLKTTAAPVLPRRVQ